MAKNPKPKPPADGLEYWIEPINRAGMFGRGSSADKGIVDRSTVGEFATAANALFGIELSDIADGADPPDVVARIGQRPVGFELVELCKSEIREKRLRRARGEAYSGNDEFNDSQWDQPTFESRVNHLLDKKNALYLKTGFTTDALLIHSDELWLSFSQVEGWLDAVAFAPRSQLRSAYLLLTYDPSYGEAHWPLFRLYGDLLDLQRP